jgi:hypothetical protein
MKVPTRHDQRVTWMKLPQIDSGEYQIVFQNDLGRAGTLRNLAKDALIGHCGSGTVC